MKFAGPRLKKEISEFSWRKAPPAWLPATVFGPNKLPTCALAPPRISIPYPGFVPGGPETLFVMFVGPRVVNTLLPDSQTPGPVLLLMSTDPAKATSETSEMLLILIPPPPLWSKVPLAPMITSDIPPTRRPTPPFPLLVQAFSEIFLLSETEIPSPPGLVTLSP